MQHPTVYPVPSCEGCSFTMAYHAAYKRSRFSGVSVAYCNISCFPAAFFGSHHSFWQYIIVFCFCRKPEEGGGRLYRSLLDSKWATELRSNLSTRPGYSHIEGVGHSVVQADEASDDNLYNSRSRESVHQPSSQGLEVQAAHHLNAPFHFRHLCLKLPAQHNQTGILRGCLVFAQRLHDTKLGWHLSVMLPGSVVIPFNIQCLQILLGA